MGKNAPVENKYVDYEKGEDTSSDVVAFTF